MIYWIFNFLVDMIIYFSISTQKTQSVLYIIHDNAKAIYRLQLKTKLIEILKKSSMRISPEHVIVESIVTRQGYQTSPSGPHWIKDLHSCISPYLLNSRRGREIHSVSRGAIGGVYLIRTWKNELNISIKIACSV